MTDVLQRFGFASGLPAFFTTPSSANLAAAMTDETGSGACVFGTSPTFITPALGTPQSGALSGCSAYPFSALTGVLTASQMGAFATGVPSGILFSLSGVNFNSANTDNAINITLPSGFSRYLISVARLWGASGTLTTATCGLFTATGAGGTAIVTSGTAITVNTASEGTNNNSMSFTINNANSLSYLQASVPTLYFRVQNAQGSAATGNVGVVVTPFV